MGIEEEEVQTKGLENIVNKIIAENFPNLGKDMVIHVQEVLGNQTDKTKKKKKTFPHHIIFKTLST
jgi:hypothetical protein